MNDEINRTNGTERPRTFPWTPVLAVAILALGGLSFFYENAQTEDLRRQVVAYQKDNAALRSGLSKSDLELQTALDAVREELASTRQDTNSALTKAQASVRKHADLVAGRIAQQQKEQGEQLSAELDKVKESANETTSKLDETTTKLDGKLDGISTEVGAVKSDVASARSNIEETKGELQRARGDMGVMSGLIATNSKEVQYLRDLGDRNIYEFTILRTAGMQKVGDIQVTLKKVDTKRNRYTLDVRADDRLVEKRDKTINEPVQFYTSQARQPYELVVNQVQKDKVIGYLATPKVTLSRNTSPAK
jgi:chromosome segregation ATPase